MGKPNGNTIKLFMAEIDQLERTVVLGQAMRRCAEAAIECDDREDANYWHERIQRNKELIRVTKSRIRYQFVTGRKQ